MGIFLPVRVKGTAAIAVCPRCTMKVYADDLQVDPNNKMVYCKDCVDLYDPWRLPARRAEDISLPYPRPDVTVADPASTSIGTETGQPVNFPPEVSV